MTEGTLEINLKDTQVKVEEPTTWLQKLFRKLGAKQKEVEIEVITQLQYLEKIHNIFKEVGYYNIVYLEVNGNRVYEDEEYTEDDFGKAVELAMKEEAQEVYHIEFLLQKKVGEDAFDEIDVNMYSRHNVREFPMVVSVDLEKTPQETTTFLESLKQKIDEKFGIESGEVYVDDEEEDYTEEEPAEETESSETEEGKE